MGGLAAVVGGDAMDWERLPEAIKTGAPVKLDIATPNSPFWETLVVGIAPLAVPTARIAAERLGIAKAGPLAVLDVGGGSGVFAATWLTTNSQATATQLDWAPVNHVAREYVARFGVADRFHTIDGDLHEVDLGEQRYDYAIYSNIAHQESPESNRSIFGRLRRALRPGGTLVISDFVLHDDRTGHPFAQIFHCNMLLATQAGASWREGDYRAWLSAAGFGQVIVQRLEPMPSTIVYASE